MARHDINMVEWVVKSHLCRIRSKSRQYIHEKSICFSFINSASVSFFILIFFNWFLLLNLHFIIVAIFFGDPHISTLDGKRYTFNGLGEYTLLDIQTVNASFLLQGRTERVTNSKGNLTDATIFSAFAAKDNSNASVQVELSADKTGRRFKIPTLWRKKCFDAGSASCCFNQLLTNINTFVVAGLCALRAFVCLFCTR